MQIPGLGALSPTERDHWYAYELPVGVAILLRMALEPLLGQRTWLELLVSCLLLAGAAWRGWRREEGLRGRHEPTIVMSLAFWKALAVSTVLTFGLVGLLGRSDLVALGRWQPLPMITGLWAGLFFLTLGAARNRARHVYLGLWLCGVIALLPLIGSNIGRALAAALGIGGAMILCGWLTQRTS